MSDDVGPPHAGTVASFGSVNIDVVAYPDRLPVPGETVHALRYALSLGGKGANQAAAVARLGQAVELAGRTGDDARRWPGSGWEHVASARTSCIRPASP